MKTLLEYLLAEAVEIPGGFKKIDLRGALSDAAKEILDFSSYKKAKAAAEAQPEKIIQGLGNIPVKEKEDPLKFLEEFFSKNCPKLNAFVNEPSKKQKLSVKMDNSVVLSLEGQWKDVGGKGKVKSSAKVIRFWLASLMTAYGIKAKVGYAYSEGANILLVYKK